MTNLKFQSTEKMVIIAVNDEGKQMFYGIDSGSGYPYWSSGFYGCHVFKDEDEARKHLSSDLFTRNSEMSGGGVTETHPPHMIYSGIGLCNSKSHGSLRVAIARMGINPDDIVHEFTIETDRVIKPTAESQIKVWDDLDKMPEEMKKWFFISGLNESDIDNIWWIPDGCESEALERDDVKYAIRRHGPLTQFKLRGGLFAVDYHS